jgi:hypothetical protein
MKQGHQFGGAITDVFVWLADWLSLRLPTGPKIGDGLKRPGLIVTPESETPRLSLFVSFLN